MLFKRNGNQSEAEATSFRRRRAVIEFDLDGKILEANELLLQTAGLSVVR